MKKQEIPEAVWPLTEAEGVAYFPGAKRRIPNFTGVEQCAARAGQLDVGQKAKTIKANLDWPQRAIRHLVLKQAKIIFTPRGDE